MSSGNPVRQSINQSTDSRELYSRIDSLDPFLFNTLEPLLLLTFHVLMEFFEFLLLPCSRQVLQALQSVLRRNALCVSTMSTRTEWSHFVQPFNFFPPRIHKIFKTSGEDAGTKTNPLESSRVCLFTICFSLVIAAHARECGADQR